MKKNSYFKDIIVIGFALFASFFGAGNLIFPPGIGLASGNQWLTAMAAFILSGIILPVCSFVAVSRGENAREEGIAIELGAVPAKIIISILMICGSMIIVVPRTASVTYEMSVVTFFPDFPKIPFCIGFFVVVFLLCINRSKVMDYVGKFLTPFLLIAMLAIVIKGIISPIGEPVDLQITNVFQSSFIGGYQTLDAVGGIAFSGAVMLAIEDKGYKDKKIQRSFALKCALVAGIGLLVIYGGLCYIGATASGLFTQGTDNTELLTGIIEMMMGKTGMRILAVAVLFACLTTAIGSVAGFASYFERISEGKISYKAGVSVICIAGILISVLSVSQIINMASPILMTVYPVVIVLILLGLVQEHIHVGKKGIYMGAVYATLIVTLLDTLSSSFGMDGLSNMLSRIPLYSAGFGWILPAVIFGAVGYFFTRKK